MRDNPVHGTIFGMNMLKSFNLRKIPLHELPELTQLIKQAWDVVRNNAVALLIIIITLFAIQEIIDLTGRALLYNFVLRGSAPADITQTQLMEKYTDFIPWLNEQLGHRSVIIVLITIGMIPVQLLGRALIILLTLEYLSRNNAANTIDYQGLVRRGLERLGTLFITRLKFYFWAIAGFFFFIFPGILVMIQFIFADITALTDDVNSEQVYQGPLQRSAVTVGLNAGYIVRIGMMWLSWVLIIMVVKTLLLEHFFIVGDFNTLQEFAAEFFTSGHIAVLIGTGIGITAGTGFLVIVITVLYRILSDKRDRMSTTDVSG